MDTFFRRHFKRKEAGEAIHDGHVPEPCRHRRPSIAVPASRARRRSSVGIPSTALTQRRRSSVQLQAIPRITSSQPVQKSSGRRRSSTTTPKANPRFAVRRKKVGKLRNIDTHLLGPSMLLASLIQMTQEEEEDEESRSPLPGQVELKGCSTKFRSHTDVLLSEGDSDSEDSSSHSKESHHLELRKELLEEVDCQTGRSKSLLSYASRNAFLWLWWQSVSRPTRWSESPAASGGTHHIMATWSRACTSATAAAARGGAVDGSPPSRKREAPGQEEACRFLTEEALPATGVMRLSILSWELITIPGWSLGVDSCRM